jgi:hypothetical protein
MRVSDVVSRRGAAGFPNSCLPWKSGPEDRTDSTHLICKKGQTGCLDKTILGQLGCRYFYACGDCGVTPEYFHLNFEATLDIFTA